MTFYVHSLLDSPDLFTRQTRTKIRSNSKTASETNRRQKIPSHTTRATSLATDRIRIRCRFHRANRWWTHRISSIDDGNVRSPHLREQFDHCFVLNLGTHWREPVFESHRESTNHWPRPWPNSPNVMETDSSIRMLVTVEQSSGIDRSVACGIKQCSRPVEGKLSYVNSSATISWCSRSTKWAMRRRIWAKIWLFDGSLKTGA